LNDLECPIQLKVRFTDGTLDVRLLQVSDSTVRIGVARGGRRGGLEGLAPPCGQLTRCFSAVAELLVASVTKRGADQWTQLSALYHGKHVLHCPMSSLCCSYLLNP